MCPDENRRTERPRCHQLLVNTKGLSAEQVLTPFYKYLRLVTSKFLIIFFFSISCNDAIIFLIFYSRKRCLISYSGILLQVTMMLWILGLRLGFNAGYGPNVENWNRIFWRQNSYMNHRMELHLRRVQLTVLKGNRWKTSLLCVDVIVPCYGIILNHRIIYSYQ